MKTGAKLIAKERKEQIKKHGFDISNDLFYSDNELLKGALFCINPDLFEWPFNWEYAFASKIRENDRVSQLKKAGAFIAAEIDRIRYIQGGAMAGNVGSVCDNGEGCCMAAY